jgi:ankyrin repeat protein
MTALGAALLVAGLTLGGGAPLAAAAAACVGSNQGALDWLLAAGVRADAPCYFSKCRLCVHGELCAQLPLHLAAAQHDLPAVASLLAAGADVCALSSHGWSALELALLGPRTPGNAADYAAVAAALLAAGADVRCARGVGEGRALDLAARAGDAATFAALLAAGADAKLVAMLTRAMAPGGNLSDAVTHYAALASERDFPDVLIAAVGARVPVDARSLDAHQMTLLQTALFYRANNAALALMELGADVNAMYKQRNIARTPQAMLGVELQFLGDEHTRLRLERCVGQLHWQDVSVLDLAQHVFPGRPGASQQVVDALLARGAKTAAQLGGGQGEEDMRWNARQG